MMKIKSFIKTVFSDSVENSSSTAVNENESTQAHSEDSTATHAEGSSTATDTEQVQNTGKESTSDENEKRTARKAKIYNLIIVDESGSMGHLRQTTLSGINEMLTTIREAQKEFADTQTHFLTLVTFDSRGSMRESVRTLYDAVPIDKVAADFDNYHPSGCTPLYDAMGQSFTTLRDKVGEDPDAAVVATILTDGLENDSREWRPEALRKLIMQLKELGWSFSYMGSAHDVKEVTDLLAIDNVMEWAHDARGSMSSWRREGSSKHAYFLKMSQAFSCQDSLDSEEEMVNMKRRFAGEYYGHRVTPEFIRDLQDNEVLVFGSNIEGQHNGGLAKMAKEKFGAKQGQGEGPQGQCYAIPTANGMQMLNDAVKRFIEYARQNPDKNFLVTCIGCGTAGYTPYDIAPMFEECIGIENVALPKEFWSVLGIKNYNI